MFPASFEYFRVTNLDDAIRLLGEHDEAKVLAGGHSLLPMMKLRLAQPGALIDIGRVAELKGIRRDDDVLQIGALTTHSELVTSQILATHCPIVCEAAAKIADPAVRNRGTIGGSIAHADPASDLPAVLVVAKATIHLVGPRGRRSVAAGDFFVDLLTTDIRDGEILTVIELADLHGSSGHSGSCYLKVEQPASGYAICGAAAVVRKNADGSCAEARLAFNGVSATPWSSERLAQELAGGPLDDAVIDQAVHDHVVIDDPLTDIHASALYRAELAKIYGKRALKAARDKARG